MKMKHFNQFVAGMLVYICMVSQQSTAQNSIPLVVKKQEDAVVHIMVSEVLDTTLYSAGTGFFIDDKGKCITNYHVVEDFLEDNDYKLFVKTKKEEVFEIDTIFGFNQQKDIFVFGIKTAQKSQFLEIDNNTPTSGDNIYVIGHPKDFSWIFSKGYISNSSVNLDDSKYILMDITVMPGNSGSPVLNEEGRVVGMTSQVYSSFYSMNSFALSIPAEYFSDISPYCHPVESEKICINIDYDDYDIYEDFSSESYYESLSYLDQLIIKKALYYDRKSFIECANMYYDIGEYQKAIYDYLFVFELNEKDEEVLFGLAKSYYWLDDNKQSMYYCKRLLSLNKQHTAGKLLKSQLLIEKGKVRRALRISKKLIKKEYIMKTLLYFI